MAESYENVCLSLVSDDGIPSQAASDRVKVSVYSDNDTLKLTIDSKKEIVITKQHELASFGKKSIVLSSGAESKIFKFQSEKDAKKFKECLKREGNKMKESVFTERTDPASAEQYFQFYSYLSQQQNMMQDYIRTSTYQRAMLDNYKDFEGKVVLDVGAGSGILSFFAVQAGAKKVYAIEASSMADFCQNLVIHNKMSDKVDVIHGKVEDVKVPELIDIIISEPMGYMLFNERMLESYLHAKKWLKPGGKMFPSQGDLHIAPFTDEALYMEQFSKANFWYQMSFHGVDLSSLREAAEQEYFKQPIVDTFDVRICMSWSHKYTIDFQSAHEKDLHTIEIPVSFTIMQSGTVHGLAFWFDVAFIGSQTTIWLSTAPTQPLTHWYQVRCLLQNPLFVKQGQTLTGKVVLKSNPRQSYDVEIELSVPGTSSRSSNILDLKNPFFRYTGVQPSAPPGTNHMSPSDSYWHNQDPTLAGDAQMNGIASASAAAITPINPGSIPAATIMNNQQQTRTSVGAGISPIVFSQNTSQSYPISNQFMIGDYAVPGSMVLPSQGLDLINKSG